MSSREEFKEDVVLSLRDMSDKDNPAAVGQLVFRNAREELLKLSDRSEFFQELQEFLDEIRDYADDLGRKHGVKLNMEVVFDIKKIKFRRVQVK